MFLLIWVEGGAMMSRWFQAFSDGAKWWKNFTPWQINHVERCQCVAQHQNRLAVESRRGISPARILMATVGEGWAGGRNLKREKTREKGITSSITFKAQHRLFLIPWEGGGIITIRHPCAVDRTKSSAQRSTVRFRSFCCRLSCWSTEQKKLRPQSLEFSHVVESNPLPYRDVCLTTRCGPS